MSTEHLIRTLATLIAFFTILVAYIYLSSTGTAPALAGRLEGMLAILTPAVLDTLRVGRRERHQPGTGAPSPQPSALTARDIDQLRT